MSNFFFPQKHKPTLSQDEITTVKKNLETKSVEVDQEFVSDHL